jgi:hypothetical protein
VPTFDRLALFKREYRRLTPEQQARFKVAVAKLVSALSQTPPRVPGEPLVNPLAGHRGVYELRFARMVARLSHSHRRSAKLSRMSSGVGSGAMRCSTGRSAIAGLIGALPRISVSTAQR